MNHTTIDSPIGALTLVRDGARLTGLYFPHHWTRPDRATFGSRTEHGFTETARQFGEYFAGERTAFTAAIRADGDEIPARGVGADQHDPVRRNDDLR